MITRPNANLTLSQLMPFKICYSKKDSLGQSSKTPSAVILSCLVVYVQRPVKLWPDYLSGHRLRQSLSSSADCFASGAHSPEPYF
jgi:hypothetical protein